MRSALVCLCCAALVLAGDGAWAMSGYVSNVPNGSVFSCQTCHLSASGGGTRNGFGNAYASNSSWSSLYAIDCDGDAQTNGQELGDPCGDWSQGGTPGRTSDISNPGDSASTSASPNVPSCTAQDAGSVPVVDAAVAADGSTPVTDAGTVPADAAQADLVGSDAYDCEPVCLDLERLYDCNQQGQHFVLPCPPGHYCEGGECILTSTEGERGEEEEGEGGCGCSATSPAGGLCGLVAVGLLAARRRSGGRGR